MGCGWDIAITKGNEKIRMNIEADSIPYTYFEYGIKKEGIYNRDMFIKKALPDIWKGNFVIKDLMYW